MTLYNGMTGPGLPPQVRELPHLIVTKASVGPMDNNSYLLRCRATGRQALIDAAAEAKQILALIGSDGLDLIVTTHRHADHVGALADVQQATGARTAAHVLEAPFLPVSPDLRLEGGEVLAWGEVRAEVIHLAGHTPGGVALLIDDLEGHPHLFTGDSLFPGGVGATGGDTKAFMQLLDEVTTKVFDRLPDETWVYPGHGHDTTLGAQRPHLGAWRHRGW